MGKTVNKGRSMKLFGVQQNPGTDPCAVDSDNTYNTDVFSYRVRNFHGAGRSELVDFSSDHTNLRFQDGVGTSMSEIDVDTKMRQGAEWHPRGRQQLSARVYHAVPNLSRGKSRADESGAAMFGEVSHDRSTALSGVSVDRMEPVSQAHKEVQNPDHIIPQWTRSGDDTRQATRTLAYVGSDGNRRETPANPWTQSQYRSGSA